MSKMKRYRNSNNIKSRDNNGDDFALHSTSEDDIQRQRQWCQMKDETKQTVALRITETIQKRVAYDVEFGHPVTQPPQDKERITTEPTPTTGIGTIIASSSIPITSLIHQSKEQLPCDDAKNVVDFEEVYNNNNCTNNNNVNQYNTMIPNKSDIIEQIKQCSNLTDLMNCLTRTLPSPIIREKWNQQQQASSLSSLYTSVRSICDWLYHYEECYLTALHVCSNVTKRILMAKNKNRRKNCKKNKKKMNESKSIKNTDNHIAKEEAEEEGRRVEETTISMTCPAQQLYSKDKNNDTCREIDNCTNEKDTEKIIVVDELQKMIQFILDQCPTDSCLAKCISIYGMIDRTIAVQLFHDKYSSCIHVCLDTNENEEYNSINKSDDKNNNNNPNNYYCNKSNHKSLHAVLASCVPTGEWKVAMEIIQSVVTVQVANQQNKHHQQQEQQIITTSCCNLLLHAMYSANNAGREAYDLLQKMKNQEKIILINQSYNNNNNENENNLDGSHEKDGSYNLHMSTSRWPPPDRHSFLYVMNALLKNSNYDNKSINIRNKHNNHNDNAAIALIDMAFITWNEMNQYEGDRKQQQQTSPTEIQDAGSKCRFSEKTNHDATCDLFLRTYQQHGDEIMANYISDKIRNQNCSYNADYPDPKQIRNTFCHSRVDKAISSACMFQAVQGNDNNNNEKTNHQNHPTNNNNNNDNIKKPVPDFLHWQDNTTSGDKTGFVKHGRGRVAYWSFAKYHFGTVSDSKSNGNKNNFSNRSFTVALQPHRQPSKNGIKILLYDSNHNYSNSTTNHNQQKAKTLNENSMNDVIELDHKPKSPKKVGFLLLINSAMDNDNNINNNSETNKFSNANKNNNFAGISLFLGLYLDPAYRKEKLSKLFVAIWLDLCFKANLKAETGIINKPLLALTFQHTFAFCPSGGFDVQIVNINNKNPRTETSSSQHYSDNNDSYEPNSLNKKQKIDHYNHIDDNDDVGISTNNNKHIVLLHAPSTCKSLVGGAIAATDLKREHIQLIKEKPTMASLGRVFRLGCTMQQNMKIDNHNATASGTLREIVSCQLAGPNGTGHLVYHYENMPWTTIMLGR